MDYIILSIAFSILVAMVIDAIVENYKNRNNPRDPDDFDIDNNDWMD